MRAVRAPHAAVALVQHEDAHPVVFLRGRVRSHAHRRPAVRAPAPRAAICVPVGVNAHGRRLADVPAHVVGVAVAWYRER